MICINIEMNLIYSDNRIDYFKINWEKQLSVGLCGIYAIRLFKNGFEISFNIWVIGMVIIDSKSKIFIIKIFLFFSVIKENNRKFKTDKFTIYKKYCYFIVNVILFSNFYWKIMLRRVCTCGVITLCLLHLWLITISYNSIIFNLW